MFPERLKSTRLLKGISQKALASKLFISQQAYAKYEAGTASPNPDVLSRIAYELNVSVDYLLGNSEQKENSPAVTNDDEAVSEEDAALLEAFRKADPATQDVIRRFLKSLEAE